MLLLALGILNVILTVLVLIFKRVPEDQGRKAQVPKLILPAALAVPSQTSYSPRFFEVSFR